jgi:hypothetical protein
VVDLQFGQEGKPWGEHYHMSSPVLADGRLVYYELAGGRMHGVDAATGRVLWIVSTPAGKQQNPSAPGTIDGFRGHCLHMAPGGTPVVMRLPALSKAEGGNPASSGNSAGASETVVVANHGLTVRVRDGKLLGQVRLSSEKKPYQASYYSAVAHGDVVFLGGEFGPLEGVRLTITGETLAQEMVWKDKLGYDNRNINLIYAHDRIYGGPIDTKPTVWFGALNASTGELLKLGNGVGPKGYSTGLAVTADRVIVKDGGYRNASRLRQRFGIATMPDVDRAGWGYLVPPPMPEEVRARHIAFLGRAAGAESNDEHAWGHGGLAAWGNRLFIRNNDYIWCIGDPDKPWIPPEYMNVHESAADQAAISQINAVGAVAELRPWLEDARIWRRHAALLRFQAIAANGGAALVDTIKKIVLGESHKENRVAAVLALEAVQSGTGRQTVSEALTTAIDVAGGWTVSEPLGWTLVGLPAPLQQELLKSMLVDARPAARRAAIHVMRKRGLAPSSLRPVLLECQSKEKEAMIREGLLGTLGALYGDDAEVRQTLMSVATSASPMAFTAYNAVVDIIPSGDERLAFLKRMLTVEGVNRWDRQVAAAVGAIVAIDPLPLDGAKALIDTAQGCDQIQALASAKPDDRVVPLLTAVLDQGGNGLEAATVLFRWNRAEAKALDAVAKRVVTTDNQDALRKLADVLSGLGGDGELTPADLVRGAETQLAIAAKTTNADTQRRCLEVLRAYGKPAIAAVANRIRPFATSEKPEVAKAAKTTLDLLTETTK